eukprot:g2785.t1
MKPIHRELASFAGREEMLTVESKNFLEQLHARTEKYGQNDTFVKKTHLNWNTKSASRLEKLDDIYFRSRNSFHSPFLDVSDSDEQIFSKEKNKSKWKNENVKKLLQRMEAGKALSEEDDNKRREEELKIGTGSWKGWEIPHEKLLKIHLRRGRHKQRLAQDTKSSAKDVIIPQTPVANTYTGELARSQFWSLFSSIRSVQERAMDQKNTSTPSETKDEAPNDVEEAGKKSPRHAYLEACAKRDIRPNPVIIRNAQKYSEGILDFREFTFRDSKSDVVEALCEALKTLPKVRSMNFASCRLESHQVQLVMDAILARQAFENADFGGQFSKYTSLHSLDLSGNDLSKAWPSLLSFLGKDEYLNHIYLSNCNVNEAQTKTFFETIRLSKSLETVDVSRNNLTFSEDTTYALVDYVEHHKNPLRRLNLAMNRFGETHEAIHRFWRAISDSPSLVDLDLQGNALSPESCEGLAAMLRSNHILLSLNLSYNMIDDSVVLQMAEALRENRGSKLQDLDIQGNPYLKLNDFYNPKTTCTKCKSCNCRRFTPDVCDNEECSYCAENICINCDETCENRLLQNHFECSEFVVNSDEPTSSFCANCGNDRRDHSICKGFIPSTQFKFKHLRPTSEGAKATREAIGTNGFFCQTCQTPKENHISSLQVLAASKRDLKLHFELVTFPVTEQQSKTKK